MFYCKFYRKVKVRFGNDRRLFVYFFKNIAKLIPKIDHFNRLYS
jgi:hypothetical protein